MLCPVHNYVTEGSRPHLLNATGPLKAFKQIQNELSVTADGAILLRSAQIGLPSLLHDKAVDTAHEGYQGISKTKALL